MFSLFLSGLYLFFFVFSCWLVLEFGFKVLKTMALKTGKIEMTKWTSPTLGLAISYIIMALVIGL